MTVVYNYLVIERTLLNVPEEWTCRSGRDDGAVRGVVLL